MGQMTFAQLQAQCMGCCSKNQLQHQYDVALDGPVRDIDGDFMGKGKQKVGQFEKYMKHKKKTGISIEEIDEADHVKGKMMKVQSEAIGKTKASGFSFFKKQKASLLSTEQSAKGKSVEVLEGNVPSKYKGQYNMAKSLYTADDKSKAVEGFVPDSYKGSFQTAMSSYDKAKDLQKQKNELQIKMFVKAIDPLWKQYDPKDRGHISQDQFKDLAKQALEKAGHRDKFDEKIFQEAVKQMVKNDKGNPEGNLTKRAVAELLNTLVFGGV